MPPPPLAALCHHMHEWSVIGQHMVVLLECSCFIDPNDPIFSFLKVTLIHRGLAKSRSDSWKQLGDLLPLIPFWLVWWEVETLWHLLPSMGIQPLHTDRLVRHRHKHSGHTKDDPASGWALVITWIEHELWLYEEAFIEQNAALFLNRSAPRLSCELRTWFQPKAAGGFFPSQAQLTPLESLSGMHQIISDPQH